MAGQPGQPHLQVPGAVQRVESRQVVHTQRQVGVDRPPVGERDGGVEDDWRQAQPGGDSGPGHCQLGGEDPGGALGVGEHEAVAETGEESVGQPEGGRRLQSVCVQLRQASDNRQQSVVNSVINNCHFPDLFSHTPLRVPSERQDDKSSL